MDDEQLGHLTHTKDIPHEDPSKAGESLKLLKAFHNIRQGKASGGIQATLKTDGGASIHIIHDDKGIGVSDKHRFKRGVIARTPKEIDQHFGHAPGYAAALKHVLKHGKEFVNKGHHVQGDLLHSPAEDVKKTDGHTIVTPNAITYKAKTNAPVGIAVHTEVKNGVAQALSKGALKHSDNVFVPQHEFKANPATYSEKDKSATEKHIAAAEKLLSQHTTDHLTPHHRKHFTTYLNRTTRTNTVPSVEGYKKHLASIGEKESNKLKTPVGQMRKASEYAGHVAHVESNKEAFQRSIDIRHHLGQATEHLLKGISHPDMETSINGKKSPGEGIVLQKNNRPVSKLVPQKVSNAILNNTRFQKV
jgi:hypothetical protein